MQCTGICIPVCFGFLQSAPASKQVHIQYLNTFLAGLNKQLWGDIPPGHVIRCFDWLFVCYLCLRLTDVTSLEVFCLRFIGDTWQCIQANCIICSRVVTLFGRFFFFRGFAHSETPIHQGTCTGYAYLYPHPPQSVARHPNDRHQQGFPHRSCAQLSTRSQQAIITAWC